MKKFDVKKKPFINTSGRKKKHRHKRFDVHFWITLNASLLIEMNAKKIKAYWEWKNENEYWIFDTSLQIRQIWNEICLCENKFNYNTPYILFNSLCTQSKSYFGHIKNSNSKRESVNIYHVTLTLLKVQNVEKIALKRY